MYARTKNWELGKVTVAVDYDHRATPRRFEITIELTGDLTREQLERLEKVAESCPLRRALETGFEFVERLENERGGDRDVVFGLRRSGAARAQPCG